MELTDSDDDATWTPFKGAKGGVGPAGRLGNDVDYEEDLDDEDDGEDEEDYSDRSRKQPSSSSGSLPGNTRVVAEGADFRVGDFMVLRRDADKDNVPIWRWERGRLKERERERESNRRQRLNRRPLSLQNGQ